MAVKIRPLGDRVLVKPIEEAEVKKGGIIIPDTAKEKPQEGKIVQVGPGKRDEAGKLVPMEVKKGDKVLFSKYGGTEVKYNGEEYLILRERDIHAVASTKDDGQTGLYTMLIHDYQLNPKVFAADFSQLFLGVRMQCAECHKAPPSHFMEHFSMVSQRAAGSKARVDQCYACHATDSFNNIRKRGWYDHH